MIDVATQSWLIYLKIIGHRVERCGPDAFHVFARIVFRLMFFVIHSRTVASDLGRANAILARTAVKKIGALSEFKNGSLESSIGCKVSIRKMISRYKLNG